MSERPRLLDLFCGAGGSAVGYHRAGFDVVGVDIAPQKNYPYEFHQADAMTFPLEGFDAIHASPPCQAFTTARVIHGKEHPDLLTPTRAPMRADYRLCGSQFGEPRLVRHRWFEASWPVDLVMLPKCAHGPEVISVFGHGGHIYHGVQNWREVMGIDWMTRAELAQAIPPSYTEWIGTQMLRSLAVSA